MVKQWTHSQIAAALTRWARDASALAAFAPDPEAAQALAGRFWPLTALDVLAVPEAWAVALAARRDLVNALEAAGGPEALAAAAALGIPPATIPAAPPPPGPGPARWPMIVGLGALAAAIWADLDR